MSVLSPGSSQTTYPSPPLLDVCVLLCYNESLHSRSVCTAQVFARAYTAEIRGFGTARCAHFKCCLGRGGCTPRFFAQSRPHKLTED